MPIQSSIQFHRVRGGGHLPGDPVVPPGPTGQWSLPPKSDMRWRRGGDWPGHAWETQRRTIQSSIQFHRVRGGGHLPGDPVVPPGLTGQWSLPPKSDMRWRRGGDRPGHAWETQRRTIQSSIQFHRVRGGGHLPGDPVVPPGPTGQWSLPPKSDMRWRRGGDWPGHAWETQRRTNDGFSGEGRQLPARGGSQPAEYEYGWVSASEGSNTPEALVAAKAEEGVELVGQILRRAHEAVRLRREEKRRKRMRHLGVDFDFYTRAAPTHPVAYSGLHQCTQLHFLIKLQSSDVS
ncbi:hypothetical protein GPALN_013070 [Globodera pallida]|nr:hypothetical protein GPALN_013070 [Globodera pallida]